MRTHPRTIPYSIVLMCVVSLGVLAPPALASQWALNGIPVELSPSANVEPEIAPDGEGGVLITWWGNGARVQRLNAWGRAIWTTNGVPLDAGGFPHRPVVVSDGAGGAIVAWAHNSDGPWDVRAQRVNAAGNTVWPAGGVVVCGAGGDQVNVQIVSDDAGGAIIAWEDFRSLTAWDVYTQRLSANGTAMWQVDGVPACIAATDQKNIRTTADGEGGVIIVFEDGRNLVNVDIWAQRVKGGVTYYSPDGLPICSAVGHQRNPVVVSDGAYGAIFVWEDQRSGVTDMYAQRLSAFAVEEWTTNGVPVCTATGLQSRPSAAADGSGGVVVAWEDLRSVSTVDVYAQRVDAYGTPLWTLDGIAVCAFIRNQTEPRVIADGTGGGIVTWTDTRSSVFLGHDIYAQRVDPSGNAAWTANGVSLCNAGRPQQFPRIATDGEGGAIVAWEDLRRDIQDVYAQRIDRWGNWGYASPDVAGVLDVPGDQGGQVNVAWDASRFDPWPAELIDVYTIWRAISPVAAEAFLKTGAPAWESDSRATLDVNRTIRVEQIAGAPSYWQLVGEVDAYGLDSYAFAAETLFDSTAASPEASSFQVIAHQFTGNRYWVSESADGHSVDNLAPLAPLELFAERVGPDVLLTWRPSTASDLRDYAVYRATASGVTPDPIFYLSSSIDTTTTDSNAPTSDLYYVVAAWDVHDNQSAPSNEATVPGAPTGVEDTPRLSALTLRPNSPNPFATTTSFAIGSPGEAEAAVEVFDVAGRRVRADRVRMSAGWQEMRFDGMDDAGRRLPSGVYFYRVTANRETVTRKIVITR